MKKKWEAIVLMLALLFLMMVSPVFAGSTINSTLYNRVLKENKVVYCTGAGGIYKVKVKSGKVKSSKKLVKASVAYGKNCLYGSMIKDGDYLYYCKDNYMGPQGTYYRVNIKSKTKNKLTGMLDMPENFVINEEKIYYDYYEEIWDDYSDDPIFEGYRTKSMNLDGSSKQFVDVKVKTSYKKSNDANYSVVMKKSGKYVKDYLKTPKGKYYLGKVKISHKYD